MSRLVWMAVLAVFGTGLFFINLPYPAAADDRYTITDDFRGEGFIPQCDDPKVLRKIVSRFDWADRNTFHRGLSIGQIENTRQRALRPRRGNGTIGRRYCAAKATLSNGRQPRVHYMIEERQGFASISWNVEFCLDGLDSWHVYDAWCRTVRP